MYVRAALMGLVVAVLGGQTLAADSTQPSAAPPSTEGLAPHRALYTMTLDTSRTGAKGGGDVRAAQGSMGFEVVDTCDGWAVRQRLRMTITDSDGQSIEMATDYSTWESRDGQTFRFTTKQMTDAATTSETDGSARFESPGGAGEVHYTVPGDTSIPLSPGTLFPMSHTAAVIAAAREGKKFVNLPLFDGTDENGPEDSTVAVLDWKSAAVTPRSTAAGAALAGLASTRVRLAFFDRQPGTTTPGYEVSMRYWENGVADDMMMDFGDFVMTVKMTEFSVPPRHC